MLTDIAIRTLKPAAKSYKRGDEKGLFVLVQPSGSLLWRFKNRFYWLERALSFGKYPDVTLKMAREKRDEARAILAEGVHPRADRQHKVLLASIVAATMFSVVAEEFIEKMERENKAPATIKKARWLRNELHPLVGRRPVADITPHELLDSLKRMERSGRHETAQRPAHSLAKYSDTLLRH